MERYFVRNGIEAVPTSLALISSRIGIVFHIDFDRMQFLIHTLIHKLFSKNIGFLYITIIGR